MRPWRWVLIALLLAATGCSDDSSEVGSAFAPGTGITVGGEAVSFGDSEAAVQARLGAASQVRGAAGIHHGYPDLGVTVIVKQGAVSGFLLDAGFTGRSDGIGIGSDEAAVQAAFGEPTREPFLEAFFQVASQGLFVFNYQ